MALDNIDNSLFLSDFATFQKVLLPQVNQEREANGLEPLTGDEAMDCCLDMINEHRKKADAND